MKQETTRERGYDLGPTGRNVASNLRQLRGGLPLRSLESRLAKIGRRLTASALQKIEAGNRRVDVDELVALAYVLRTTPNKLLLPPAAKRGTNVEATGIGEVDAAELWDWARGDHALYRSDGEDPDEAQDRFEHSVHPDGSDLDLESFVRSVRRAAQGGASLNVTDAAGHKVASFPKGFDPSELFNSEAFKRAVREAMRDE